MTQSNSSGSTVLEDEATRMAGILARLAEPLDPKLVKRREGANHRMFRYLPGHTVIAQANRIFGPQGWGCEVLEPARLECFDYDDVNPGTGEVRRVKVGWACSVVVKVEVVGFPMRSAVGFCDVTPTKGGAIYPDTIETARKGAETDGLKRALRTFGNQFANDLYEDDGHGSEDRAGQRAEAAKAGNQGARPAGQNGQTGQTSGNAANGQAPPTSNQSDGQAPPAPKQSNGTAPKDAPKPDQKAEKLRREILDAGKKHGYPPERIQSNAERKYELPWGEIGMAQLQELLPKVKALAPNQKA